MIQFNLFMLNVNVIGMVGMFNLI